MTIGKLEKLQRIKEQYEKEVRLLTAVEMKGHRFDQLTSACDCGMTMREMEDAKPTQRKTHDDVLHPGTMAATHRNRATGHVVHYRKPVR